jgi:hypothetical protein
MENPDQPVWDPRQEDSAVPHSEEECESLADELCNRMGGFILEGIHGYRAKAAWKILVKRMTSYYGDHSYEFYEDYKEVHG